MTSLETFLAAYRGFFAEGFELGDDLFHALDRLLAAILNLFEYQVRSSIQVKDIVGWMLAILLGASIYYLFQRNQLRIARHGLIRQLEEEIAEVFSSKVARVGIPSEMPKDREFRAVLDSRPPWIFESTNPRPPGILHASAVSNFIDGQRYWLIRRMKIGKGQEFKQFVASKAFQETLLWFRRMDRALKDDVVGPDDLLDLWRFILPFGFAGRIAYFARYFQSKEDVRAMVDIINRTLRAAKERRRQTPLRYFNSYVTEDDLAVLKVNRAARRLHDGLPRFGKLLSGEKARRSLLDALKKCIQDIKGKV